MDWIVYVAATVLHLIGLLFIALSGSAYWDDFAPRRVFEVCFGIGLVFDVLSLALLLYL